MSVRFKNARVEKMPSNIRIQWSAGTACVSECVLKTLACRGLRVGPSKDYNYLGINLGVTDTDFAILSSLQFRRRGNHSYPLKF